MNVGSMKTIDDVIRHYSKEDKLIETASFNQVSHCCLKPIVVVPRTEFPLGGSRWGISYKVDVCSGCGMEVDEPLAVTECCGEEQCTCLEKLRAEMVEKGMQLGFLHPEVIAKSKELDKLLNDMNRKEVKPK